MAMSFANGSRIFGAATSPTSISGQSVTLLIVDEAAKIEKWKVFWPSTSQTISQSSVVPKPGRLAPASMLLGPPASRQINRRRL
jgi:hypothetical protein